MEHYGIQTAAGHLTVAAESKEPYAADVLAALHEDAALVVAKYPQKRSALLPDVPTFKELGLNWVDGAYRGIGVPDCIRTGRAAARRVIAGTARGLRLLAPGPATRPLGDRVKQTLFAVLEPDGDDSAGPA